MSNQKEEVKFNVPNEDILEGLVDNSSYEDKSSLMEGIIVDAGECLAQIEQMDMKEVEVELDEEVVEYYNMCFEDRDSKNGIEVVMEVLINHAIISAIKRRE